MKYSYQQFIIDFYRILNAMAKTVYGFFSPNSKKLKPNSLFIVTSSSTTAFQPTNLASFFLQLCEFLGFYRSKGVEVTVCEAVAKPNERDQGAPKEQDAFNADSSETVNVMPAAQPDQEQSCGQSLKELIAQVKARQKENWKRLLNLDAACERNQLIINEITVKLTDLQRDRERRDTAHAGTANLISNDCAAESPLREASLFSVQQTDSIYVVAEVFDISNYVEQGDDEVIPSARIISQ